MSGAAFPSPTAEMAEMNRIHYELEYTEGISQRMRNSDEVQFPRDLDLIQSTPLESTLSLKTPPRVLTLSERPLDFLEMEQASARSQPREEVRTQTKIRRERSVSENTGVQQNGPLPRNDSVEWPLLACETAGLDLVTSNQPRLSDVSSAITEELLRLVILSVVSVDSITVTAHVFYDISRLTPSPSSALRSPAPLGGAEAAVNLFSTRGVLSFIQSSTRRAYQQVLEVLDENQRSKPTLRGGSGLSNPQHDTRYALDTALEGGTDDLTVVDATSLRRQIVKLNRRLQLLEEENKERAKREMFMYSITVAFWLINSWVWFRR
ncbi:hypothetical protein DNTS_009606 [Danionella cerebrum]|uniref:Mitochondrial fission factor n=1 Tax=Danionella cerebrum TaxID=2873325 RepID=A0A553R3I2_9TELE|nr:hypothetical protein DNTS_009606 [Danionella translucida]